MKGRAFINHADPPPGVYARSDGLGESKRDRRMDIDEVAAHHQPIHGMGVHNMTNLDRLRTSLEKMNLGSKLGKSKYIDF